MPSGNTLISEKMQFPNNGGSGGGGGGDSHHRQWFPDERDGFISWLKGEFAASNAIIDSLCHHLRSIGEHGEYDVVIGSIQQRRCNWNPVLHMQQYFSVADVIGSLHEVAVRKQQKRFGQMKVVEKDSRKPSSQNFGPRQLHKVGNVKEEQNSNLVKREGEVRKDGEVHNLGGGQISKHGKISALEEEKEGVNHVTESRGHIAVVSNPGIDANDSNPETGSEGEGSTLAGSCKALPESCPDVVQNHEDKHNLVPTPKTFVGTEIFDGKAVNVVEGLKLFEELVDSSEISKLTSMANELRLAGRKGQLKGPTYVVSKRPMKGHGREMIQLGLPVADAPLEAENTGGSLKDRKMEPIPGLLQEVIEQLVESQIISVKPDCCIIDYFNEGEHSQPHMSPSWFGKPVCVLFLTECNVTFGRIIVADRPGDYRGCLKLSLSAGSLLSIDGRSADVAKHAISSLWKQRMFITFTKSQPKKNMVTSSAAPPSSMPLGHPASRPASQFRYRPSGPPKHYGPIPTSGVLPPWSVHPPPHLPPSNGIPPLFVTTPGPPPMPYPAPPLQPPASAGWAAVVAPMHPPPPPPRFPLPGTGVFLPPPGSSDNSSLPVEQQPALATATGVNSAVETQLAVENGERSNANTISSPQHGGKLDLKVQKQESNGIVKSKTVNGTVE